MYDRLEDAGLTAAHIEEFYTNLYKESYNYRPRLEMVVLNKITEQNKRMLEERVLEGEVVYAINSLAGDKALGPDGFPLALF